MLIEFFLYPLSGFFMKISDDAQDFKNDRILGIIAGIICVLAIGYLVVTSADAATIFIAILVGTILAGKVDRLGHIITLILFIIIMALFGIPQIGFISLAICVLAAYLDEVGNDAPWTTGRKKINLFFRYRFALKIIVLFLSVCGLFHYMLPVVPGLNYFQPETFILFILFDLAYEIAGLYFDTIYDRFQSLLGFIS
jgi:hypothetical protein